MVMDTATEKSRGGDFIKFEKKSPKGGVRGCDIHMIKIVSMYPERKNHGGGDFLKFS